MRQYKELSLGERIAIQVHHGQGMSVHAIGRELGRAASTISRELRRLGPGSLYRADAAQDQAQVRRHKARVVCKLADQPLWSWVCRQVRHGWSPQQIALRLRRLHPKHSKARVSHETIYKAIYVLPRGDLRTDLIDGLRQGRSTRKPRSRGEDRRGQICDMQSIHIRPPEVEDRLIPGHWEGDLIKGAGNRSSVGTLVERTTGFVVLARMTSAKAKDALDSFGQALETIPPQLRKTLTYDRGKEMSYHAALTLRTGVAVYFADPHSPWQRGTNENTNGLLRQYMPKGTDLSEFTQDELNAIALSLNTRPRLRLDGQTPLECYTDLVTLDQMPTGSVH